MHGNRFRRVLVTGGSGFIGTNLLDALMPNTKVLNIDVRVPQLIEHGQHHLKCDILDYPKLARLFADFQPEAVVHLAARTDLVEGVGLAAYAPNIQGVENILEAVQNTPSVQRVIFASSKLVNRNGAIVSRTTDFSADTLYGQSKAIGENIVREHPPNCTWAIVRPTSIWGPWFGVPYRGFFRAIAQRRYFHITGCDLPKRFGYVGNAVAQILSILRSGEDQVNGETFYLADYHVTTIREWADNISLHLRGRRNPAAPDWVISLAAKAGDIAKIIGISEPPLSSFRLRNMQTPTADTPLDSMIQLLPDLPCSQDDGVCRTLRWLGYPAKS